MLKPHRFINNFICMFPHISDETNQEVRILTQTDETNIASRSVTYLQTVQTQI